MTWIIVSFDDIHAKNDSNLDLSINYENPVYKGFTEKLHSDTLTMHPNLGSGVYTHIFKVFDTQFKYENISTEVIYNGDGIINHNIEKSGMNNILNIYLRGDAKQDEEIIFKIKIDDNDSKEFKIKVDIPLQYNGIKYSHDYTADEILLYEKLYQLSK